MQTNNKDDKVYDTKVNLTSETGVYWYTEATYIEESFAKGCLVAQTDKKGVTTSIATKEHDDHRRHLLSLLRLLVAIAASVEVVTLESIHPRLEKKYLQGMDHVK